MSSGDGGGTLLIALLRRTCSGVIARRMKRSSAISESTDGRCTLTATSRPSLSVPLYTWPMLADAIGRGESDANAAEIARSALASSRGGGGAGAPLAAAACAARSVARMRRAARSSNGGTASCSLRSSSAYASGMRSVRIESAWPSLMNVGPSCSTSRAPRALRLVLLEPPEAPVEEQPQVEPARELREHERALEHAQRPLRARTTPRPPGRSSTRSPRTARRAARRRRPPARRRAAAATWRSRRARRRARGAACPASRAVPTATAADGRASRRRSKAQRPAASRRVPCVAAAPACAGTNAAHAAASTISVLIATSVAAGIRARAHQLSTSCTANP